MNAWMSRLLGCLIVGMLVTSRTSAADRLELRPPEGTKEAGHVVLVSGDEEYRSEETMPMLAKILSQRHHYRCTVLFCFGPDGADYIDSNNQQGLRGVESLDTADLMIIATRFRKPNAEQAAHITAFLNKGKPVIGLRTATHAFQGQGNFGEAISYDQFGRKVLGEEWVSHHGQHKVEGARSVIEPGAESHPILRGVSDIFAPTDVYGVTHLTPTDTILLRGAITKSLDPESAILKDDDRNKPMQPLAWVREYTSSGGTKGKAFCTTAGASVDFVDEDLRRLVVNAVYHLTGRDVPAKADVEYVDPFYPTFYGFINDPNYYKTLKLTPETFALGKAPHRDDPPGSPEWPHRPRPNTR